MDTLNSALTWLGDLLLAPFHAHPTTGLLVWSALTGILMTVVFGRTSNQRALQRVADDIRAQLFAVKLFKEDLLVTFQCQLQLLKSTGMRIWHSVPPMLVLIVPLFLVLTQLAMRYEYRPLTEGERVVAAVHIKPDHWKDCQDITLEAGDGFVMETESLRDEQLATIYWRVRAESSEPSDLRWRVANQTVTKELPMAATKRALQVACRRRPGLSVWDRLLYPAEPGLSSDSPIESIELQLAERETPVFGWDVPWWATFFLTSMAVAYVAGKILGVQY